MSSNRIVRDLFRSLENTLQERLAMIEDVLRLGNVRPVSDDIDVEGSLLEKLVQLEEMVSSLSSRLALLELSKREVPTGTVETVHVTHIGKERILEQDVKDLEVRVKAEPGAGSVKAEPVAVPVKAEPARTSSRVEIPPVVKAVPLNETIQIETEVAIEDGSEAAEEEVVEEEVVEEEVVEEEVVEEVVEEIVEEVEEAEEETAEEEAEEGEALELEEFEYKGKTYYKDGENQVYVLADDEEPQVIGTWDETRKRVLFRRAA